MREIPPFGLKGLVACGLILALATAARLGYLATCCESGNVAPRFVVQGEGLRPDFNPGTQLRGLIAPSQLDNLVHNLRESRWFGSLAPLANVEEQTAQVAPGYPWLLSFGTTDADIRRVQTGLSILTVLLLFLFARQVFASNLVAFIVGLLAALHPFWIVNSGELADGTVTTFLLALALFMGTHASRTGGPLSSVVFGLSLAGIALVRAAFLPFSFLAMGWFLLRCRHLRLGWFAGLLALLGFGNGLAPWSVRNQQVFKEPIPVADSAYLHLWVGNFPGATGGPIDEKTLRESLPPERLQILLAEPNQAKRYARLSHDVAKQIQDDPAGAISKRWAAGVRFLLGETWVQRRLFVDHRGDAETPTSGWDKSIEFAHQVSLLLILGLGFIGWRVSQGCAAECRLATIALLTLPLPYILSHAESLSGPRLPWDAPLILFAGYALAWIFPAVRNPEPIVSPRIQDQATLMTRKI